MASLSLPDRRQDPYKLRVWRDDSRDHGADKILADAIAHFEISEDDQEVTISFLGRWVVSCLGDADQRIRNIDCSHEKAIRLEVSGIDQLDTAGAWVIYRFHRRLSEGGMGIGIAGAEARFQTLFDVVAEHEEHVQKIPPHKHPLRELFERTGRQVERNFQDLYNSVGFFGLSLATFLRGMVDFRRFRAVSFVHHLEHAGFDAVTIIFTVSFLVGAVIAYMGGELLKEFGAEVLTVDLIAYSVLREFGVLLSAIMIAGRSGSAFTAQIGSMKANEEIDAMRTLGLNPVELLVVPRVLALVVAMPILTFIADVAGIFGGALISLFSLDVSPAMFVETLENEIELRHFLTGLVKAPVFAVLIGVIGCYQGMRVQDTAESIGEHTTRSVVQAIFAVIVADALFAMFFQEIGF
ncbi:MAG: ABC transporter permease [Alphaproteobacteria bacterium]|nr:MAG: ABC transporter permease [Alphaproteobacteria bacterium]